MVFLLFLLIIISCWRLHIKGFHDDFFSQQHTTPIKGIFTVLILYSHIRGYITMTDSWATISYNAVLDHLGQLIVAIFFFYSGFGIWESFKRKPDYVNSFFKKRFLKTLLHFDIAVAFFILVQLIVPITYTTKQYFLCWIGWESVGNSNWFIFVILALYIIALISMRLQKSIGRGAILSIGLLTAVLWIWLRILMNQPSWWVDTMAAFPLGVVVSNYKNSIMRLLGKRRAPYIVLGAAIVLFSAAYMRFGIDIYGGVTCLFCCVVVLFSSVVTIGNPALIWLGKNAFTVYIIQRLPMILFSAVGLNTKTWLFVLLVIPTTVTLAEVLSRINKKVDSLLFANA